MCIYIYIYREREREAVGCTSRQGCRLAALAALAALAKVMAVWDGLVVR